MPHLTETDDEFILRNGGCAIRNAKDSALRLMPSGATIAPSFYPGGESIRTEAPEDEVSLFRYRFRYWKRRCHNGVTRFDEARRYSLGESFNCPEGLPDGDGPVDILKKLAKMVTHDFAIKNKIESDFNNLPSVVAQHELELQRYEEQQKAAMRAEEQRRQVRSIQIADAIDVDNKKTTQSDVERAKALEEASTTYKKFNQFLADSILRAL